MSEYSQLLESAVAVSGVTGASFAYWDGGALHTAVAGMRNSVTGDPVTTDTVMHIGSITKILNAVLVMQLVEDGLISLDDPIAKHLPELRLRDMNALRQITCQMLLNHTSGIDCDIPPDHGPDQERIVDAIARCADVGQLHAPGEGPSYCNIAAVIAGYLTQKLRGTSWYSLIKGRIYEPLGMRHAIADLPDLPRFRQSVGDLTNAATGRLVQTMRPFLALSLAPAGTTLMMTAADLVTFARTLLSGGVGPDGARILSATAVAQMTQPTAKLLTPDGWYWGLGWLLLPGGLLYHSGAGPGVASVLYAHPASGCAVALLTNCDRWDALKPAVLDPILQAWTGIEESSPERLMSPINPTPYEGTYESSLFRVEVFSRDGGLVSRTTPKVRMYDNYNLSPEGNPIVTLYPVGNHTFEVASAVAGSRPRQYRFAQPDAEGRMRVLGSGVRLWVRTG